MKKIESTECKKILVVLLKKFRSLCMENDLSYCLAYGTLLGAIRHQGFIPWDDDIDICMTQTDYEKFISLFEDQNIEKDEIILLTPEIADKNGIFYQYPFAKLVDNKTVIKEKYNEKNEFGIYLDIFPITGVPSSLKAQKSLMKKLRKLHDGLCYSVMGFEKNNSFKNIIKNMYITLFKIQGYKKFRDKLCIISFQENYDDCSQVAHLVWGGYNVKKEVYYKSMYTELIMANFENNEFLIPKAFDQLLTNQYGDYTEYPPINERKGHEYSAYWKD